MAITFNFNVVKNILFIAGSIPHYRIKFFEMLKKELTKHDIELEIVTGEKNKEDQKIPESSLDWIKRIPARSIKLGNIDFVLQPGIKYLKNKDLIVVGLENKFIINYYLMFIRHYSGFRLAFWGHGRNMQLGINNLKNRFKYFFLKQCDWWFGYTTGTKEFLVSHGFPEAKITVCQNAIDTRCLRKFYNEIKEEDLNILRTKFNINSDSTGIFCGEMDKGKNISFIIDACKKIKKQIPDFNMIFVGSGNDSQKVLDISQYYKWIHYVGPSFGKDLVKYFKLASVQLMPYYVGLGVLDSFAMETPLITTSNPFHGPEIEYLINDFNGRITNDDLESYSQGVVDTIKNGKYLEYKKGCIVSAEKYTIENMVNNFKNGILTCLNETS